MLTLILPSLANALTFSVNSTTDTIVGTDCEGGGLCTLRAAIEEANAIPEATHETITLHLAPGIYTVGSRLDVLRGISLIGSNGDRNGDPTATIIQAGANANDPGNGQLMAINPTWSNGFATRIEALWIRHAYNNTTQYGGAIDWDGTETPASNVGTLMIYNCIFSENVINTAGGSGGAIGAFFGAGITLEKSVFRNNHASGQSGFGGAINIVGTESISILDVSVDNNSAEAFGGVQISQTGSVVNIARSTISNNRAEGAATSVTGGIGIADYNALVMLNSTISGNQSQSSRGGISLAPRSSAVGGQGGRLTNVTITNNRSGLGVAGANGGGLTLVNTDAPTALYNTIVAENFTGIGAISDNISGLVSAALSTNNLIGSGGNGGLIHGVNNNQVNMDYAGLFPLASNYGRTQTHALRNGSPALDAGSNSAPSIMSHDQRFWPRALAAARSVYEQRTDIGAFEAHPTISLIPHRTVYATDSAAISRSIVFYVGDSSFGQPFSIQFSSSNTALLTNEGMSLTATSTTGRRLDLVTEAGQWGSTDITITATSEYNGEVSQSSTTFTFTVVPPPDLTISKSHSGDFHQGQSDATYTLSVRNEGPGASYSSHPGSPVVVTDTLPASMTAVSMTGEGWSCDTGTVSCTRSDVLAPGASYPDITLVVSVATDAPQSVINSASVSGGGDATGESSNDPSKILYATSTTLVTGGGSTYGGDITLVATVSPTDTGIGGNVIFQRFDGSNWINLSTTPLAGTQAAHVIGGSVLGAGSYLFRALYSGDADHYQSQSADTGHIVNKAPQSISFAELANVTFGDAPLTLTATANSGLPISFASADPTVASISGTTLSIVGAGSVDISASQAGNENYLAASNVVRTLVVDKAAASVVISDLIQVYDGGSKSVTTATTPAGLSVAVSYNGVSTEPTDAGSYAVIASIDDSNYSGSSDATLEISRADQSITFAALADAKVGDAAFALGANSNSGLAISYTSSNPAVASIVGNTVTIHAAGSTDITASQSGDGNYNAATPVMQTLTVNKGTQSITFNPLADMRFDDPPLTLTATASSNLPVSYASSDPSVASINGNTLTIHAVGSITITASQAGNDDFSPASDVQQVLTIRGTEQVVTFPVIDDQLFFGSALTLTLAASSDAGLPIDYRVDSGPASIIGDQLTMHGAGNITVTADQPGTVSVEPASASRSFVVTVSPDAIWQVTHCADSGSGSLPQVLADAVSGNQIVFTADLQCHDENAISLADHGPLTIDQNLQIDGAGARIEISGGGVNGLLYVDAAVTAFTLRNLTLRDAIGYNGGSPVAFRQAVLSHSPDVTLEDLLVSNISDGSIAIVSARAGAAQLRNITISDSSGGEAPLLVRSAANLDLTAENITLHSNTANSAGAILLSSDNSTLTATMSHLTVQGVADSVAAVDLRPLLLTEPWGTGNIVVTLINSVLWNNDSLSIDGAVGAGSLTVSHSVIEGGFATGSNIADSDPLLAPLMHQGTLRYLSPLPGSSAIGAGSMADCLASDQRGVARSGRCDAGAVQPRPVTLTLTGGDAQSAVIDSDFAEPLSINVSTGFNEPIIGGRVDFTAPASGAGLTNVSQSAVIDADGNVSLAVTANGVVGSYSVNADARGSDGALSFAMENLAISTGIVLSTSSPIEAGADAVLSAQISTDGALPVGNIVFEQFDGTDWQSLASVALIDDSASYTVNALAAGAYSFRARFPGSATHNPSDWSSVLVNVYAAVAIDDPAGGAELGAGNSREFALSGGEGSAYDIDVTGPDGFSDSVNVLCDGGCSYTFSAPQTGAFAGVYTVTVADTDTGWFDRIDVSVPLLVDVQRSTLLSMDSSRNSGEVIVRGAGIGNSVSLAADVIADAAGIALSASVNAIDDEAAGNPASFAISLPDTLTSSLTVTLSANSAGAPQGNGTLLAQVATLHTGSVSGPLAEAIVGATVTLLASDGSTTLPLLDNEGNRYESVTDGNGDFILIAPPVAPGYSHFIEVMAAGYQTISEAAGNCGDCVLQMIAAVTAETPRFNPPAGEYAGWVTVRLESTTVGATLRYTLDGSTPTLSNGIEVANNTELLLATDTTIKVIAYQVGLNVSDVAEASYTLTSARFKSGAGSVGLLTLLSLLLLGWRRRLLSRKALAALLMLPAVTAQAENGWYLGGAMGWAIADIDAEDVESRMADAGIAGTATVDDENRFAWKLLAGYHWRYFGIEGGYVNLGDIAAGFDGTGPLALNDLQGVPPASGDGYELALLGRYPFHEKLAAYLRAGIMRWQTEYSLSGIGSKTFSGNDPTFGLGVEWHPHKRWITRLSLDQYKIEDDSSNLIAISLAYHFAHHGRKPGAGVHQITGHQTEVAAENSVAQVSAAEEPTPAASIQTVSRESENQPFPVGVVMFRFNAETTVEVDLTAAVEYLNIHREARIEVRGHADSSGPEVHNLPLSRLRAERIAARLQEQGIQRERITVTGVGSSMPLDDNATRAGRAMNRRVEIILIGQ